MRKETFYAVIIYASIFFAIFFVFYGFKSANDEVCTTKIISNELSASTKNIVNSNNHSFYAEIPRKYDQNIKDVGVCLSIKTNTSDYAKVNILGEQVYVNNLTDSMSCVSISYEEYNGLLSFNCENCDSNKALVIDIATEQGLHIDGTVSFTSIAYYQLRLEEYCKELYKDVMQVYFAVLGLIAFIFLLQRGLKWFWRWISL